MVTSLIAVIGQFWKTRVGNETMTGVTQFIVAVFAALLFSQPFLLMFALTTFFVVRARCTGVWQTKWGGRRWTRDEHPERFRLGVATATAGACLFGVATLMTFALVFWMFAFHSQPARNTEIREVEAPDFDPRLILAWPGAPEESRRRVTGGQMGETTIYSASFSEHQPLTSFRASVYEMTDEDLQGDDPNEWLPRHLGGGDTVELSRMQIEFGPRKYLGFEVTSRDENLFIRRINVLVGRRIYTVEVNSLRQERLSADDVEKFLASFAIKE